MLWLPLIFFSHSLIFCLSLLFICFVSESLSDVQGVTAFSSLFLSLLSFFIHFGLCCFCVCIFAIIIIPVCHSIFAHTHFLFTSQIFASPSLPPTLFRNFFFSPLSAADVVVAHLSVFSRAFFPLCDFFLFVGVVLVVFFCCSSVPFFLISLSLSLTLSSYMNMYGRISMQI